VIYGDLMDFNGDLMGFTGNLTEQATVGVRKLQHFLCKDPTAYGAIGQN